jgi:N-acetylglucosamine-6-phosphate deacetylase
MTGVTIFRNGPIFDGARLLEDHKLVVRNGVADGIAPDMETVENVIDLEGDILSPGYVDLQVNGGGGVMLNDDPSVETLARISEAHWGLGVREFLPTLITDTPDKTHAAIAAVREAVRAGVAGIAGLHLEGPHLSVARKGAHDAALIRRMEQADLDALLAAATELPVLKVTVAPENTTEGQVSALARAGVLVALGHTDADYRTCRRYAAAGARCVTHLFNAMSQLASRDPGLVGAALGEGALSSGLIADGIHVHPEAMRLAWMSKTGPGRIYLVSDAMAVAGTDVSEFRLNGRVIRRENGRLTLEDGTLAGADLDLTTAIGVLVNEVGVSLEAALAAATSVPAELIGRPTQVAGRPISHFIRISSDLGSVRAVELSQ